MQDFLKKYFTVAYIMICLLVFISIGLRAFFIPFSHDEASSFFFYIQSDNYLPYRSHIYTNNHFLNSALANVCFHIGGSHRFVLRIPNLLSFIVLCFGVYKYFSLLTKISSRVILVCFFILTFNFLDFFELCRGYGLSIGFIVLSLYYLQVYFTQKKFNFLVMFSICWQLALTANLTLVVSTALLLSLIFYFQFRNKLLFNPRNLLLQFINIILLAFWVKLSFFYKSKGVLDSGVGNDYWQVSFKSLMQFIFGTDELWMQLLVIAIFSIVLVYGLFRFFKKPFSIVSFFNPGVFYIGIVTALVVIYYLMKKLMDINFPEDRTGLFFYLFFVLAIVFFFDGAKGLLPSFAASALFTASLFYFCISYDLKSFTHYFYHVIPKEFYSYLENEHKKYGQLFTVGGHPNREMNYAFFNYRAGALLNPMDEPRDMHMNCDYYFALKCEEPFYRHFYDEVAYDTRWQRVLLKRRQKIKRHEITNLARGPIRFKGEDEFFEFLRFYDSTGTTRNCLEADVEINFEEVHHPLKAFLVLQINDENNNTLYYKRALLNWLGDDLDGKTKRIKLTSGPLKGKYKNIIVYLWNIDKRQTRLELKQLKMYNLSAPGINVAIPQYYYPYLKNIYKKELL